MKSRTSTRKFMPTMLLCLFFGFLGIHRFYVGKVATGLAMLLTAGGMGIWVLFDVARLALGLFADKSGRTVRPSGERSAKHAYGWIGAWLALMVGMIVIVSASSDSDRSYVAATSHEPAPAPVSQEANRATREAEAADRAAAREAARATREAEAANRAAAEEAEREAREAEEAARKAAEEATCRQDIQCLGDQFSIAAGVYCKRDIEDLGKYDHQWTDGLLDMKFYAFQWKDKGSGVIRFRGDHIQFQNRFGAWVKHRYWCDYDTINDSPIRVGAEPGRLQQ